MANYRVYDHLANGKNGKVYLAEVLDARVEFVLRNFDTVVIKIKEMNLIESRILR